MTVDIVLATYNGEKYLGAQIDSVLAQDEQDWRLIIRDDVSTDGTAQLIETYAQKYPQRILLLRNDKKRLSIVGNFAALLAATTHEHIMCCDQDDVWMPNKISLTLAGMKELEAVHGPDMPLLIHTDSALVDAALEPVSPSFAKHTKLNPFNSPFSRLLMQNTVQGCTMMVNRALLALALPFPPVIRMHDMWMALVAASMGQIGYIEQPTLHYRQHAQNAVGARKKTLRERTGNIQNMIEGNVTQAVLFLDRFKDRLPPEHAKTVRALATMPDYGFFKRRRILIDNKMLREPNWQNIPLLIFV